MIDKEKWVSMSTDVKGEIYEGLLQKRMEEQQKRRKKQRTVDENQLSLFGPAA